MVNTIVHWGLGAWWLAATTIYVGTLLVPLRRPPLSGPAGLPAVSVLVPVKGIDAEFAGNLEAFFGQVYPVFELIFTVADPEDPAIPLVERAIASHPRVAAQLIVGDVKVSANPKVNNLVNGERAARHPLVLISAANIALMPDTLARLVPLLTPGVGMVSAVPVALRPQNFVGELEAAFWNGHAARWFYAAAAFGAEAGLGAAMLMRRGDLARFGGMAALGDSFCDDSVLGAKIKGLGLRIVVVAEPAHHPVGRRRLRDLWERHLRWQLCLRYHNLPAFLAVPAFGITAATLTGAAFWAPLLGGWTWLGALGFALAWLAGEGLYHLRQGWRLTWRSPLAWLLREAMLAALWVRAVTARTLVWRGSRIDVRVALPARPTGR
ncbi:MAG TPA: glycosyltransferase [Stellaceae bacterium]|nr:glycosyltransferase [Stellaceae bacterium]